MHHHSVSIEEDDSGCLWMTNLIIENARHNPTTDCLWISPPVNIIMSGNWILRGNHLKINDLKLIYGRQCLTTIICIYAFMLDAFCWSTRVHSLIQIYQCTEHTFLTLDCKVPLRFMWKFFRVFAYGANECMKIPIDYCLFLGSTWYKQPNNRKQIMLYENKWKRKWRIWKKKETNTNEALVRWCFCCALSYFSVLSLVLLLLLLLFVIDVTVLLSLTQKTI